MSKFDTWFVSTAGKRPYSDDEHGKAVAELHLLEMQVVTIRLKLLHCKEWDDARFWAARAWGKQFRKRTNK